MKEKFNINGVCILKTERSYGTIFSLRDTQMLYCGNCRNIENEDCKKCIQQSKTFTLDEIRTVLTDYMRSKRKFGLQLNPTRINEILQEFEQKEEE